MKFNAFARDIEIKETTWQFVGDVPVDSDRLVWIRAGYQDHEGSWQHFPTAEVEARDGQTQEERFNEFVDRFATRAEETV